VAYGTGLCAPGRASLHGCGFKTSRLYLPPGSSRFACRQCHNLTYISAQQHSAKVDRFRELGPDTLAALSLTGNRKVSGLARRALELDAKLARKRLPLRWLKRLPSYVRVRQLANTAVQELDKRYGTWSSPGLNRFNRCNRLWVLKKHFHIYLLLASFSNNHIAIASIARGRVPQ